MADDSPGPRQIVLWARRSELQTPKIELFLQHAVLFPEAVDDIALRL